MLLLTAQYQTLCVFNSLFSPAKDREAKNLFLNIIGEIMNKQTHCVWKGTTYVYVTKLLPNTVHYNYFYFKLRSGGM